MVPGPAGPASMNRGVALKSMSRRLKLLASLFGRIDRSQQREANR